jgi:hypothetical protein
MFTREEVLDVLNKLRDVKNWRASTGCIFIITDVSLNELTAQLQRMLPGVSFILVPYDGTQANGWTDSATWDFANYPKPSEYAPPSLAALAHRETSDGKNRP